MNIILLSFTDVLFGALASLIATIVFALFLFLVLTPKVHISNQIAELQSSSGNKFYKFKFINKSLFKAFDVRFELMACVEYEATNNGEGVNVKSNDVKLTNSEILFIPKYKETKNKRYADNCVTVRVKEEDLRALLTVPNSYLEFRITLKHGFSNLSGTFTKKYKTAKCIVKGDFEFGNSFKIS